MSTATVASEVDAVLTRLETDLDELAALSWGSDTDREVLDAWVRLERVRRRLDPVEYAVIGEVEARGVPFEQGCRSTAALARGLLRITAGEAAGRVRAAAAAGPRRTLSGEALEPVYPALAAAQATGDISARHARVIVSTIEGLPDEVRAEVDRTVETILVDYARGHAPDVTAAFARDLAYHLDQDGQYDELGRAERDRGLTLRRDPTRGGAGRLEGGLTPECAEFLDSCFDVLARPMPAEDGTPDRRSAAQRRHDALLEMLKLVHRAQLLPNAAGVTATIILNMDADTYTQTSDPSDGDTGETDDTGDSDDTSETTGTGGADPVDVHALAHAVAAGGIAPGSARTGHGYTIPADIAKRWAGAEARIIAVLLSTMKAVTAYSSSHRLFTERERLVMIARDKHCSVPGCDVPAQWCEAHHVTEYQHSHRTSVDDGALVCAYHHRHFQAMGYTCTMRNGRPHWTPPETLHPNLAPRH